ncbi:MAG: putative zinc-binding protein [Rectinemataceae bacterium]
MACNCGGACETNLIYACSGAANTGLLADHVMRKLNKDGVSDSTCLAAVGAELSGFIESARSATKNIVLDGRPVACGKRIFEAKGLPFEHFVMTEFGVEKGKTAITGDLIETIASRVADSIATKKA